MYVIQPSHRVESGKLDQRPKRFVKAFSIRADQQMMNDGLTRRPDGRIGGRRRKTQRLCEVGFFLSVRFDVRRSPAAP